MEKLEYMHSNYPQLPPQMSATGVGTSAADAADEHVDVIAPPSYEQATTSTAATTTGASADTQTYPPVHVLPTPRTRAAEGINRQQPQVSSTSAQPYYDGAGASYPIHNAAGTSTYMTLRREGAPHALHQQQPQPQSVVIIQQQAMLPLGPESAFIFCPNCHIQKLTRIEYEPSTRTHLMAALLCVLGLWCCVCLPYCAGSCMNTNHYCGNCNKFLGSYGNAL